MKVLIAGGAGFIGSHLADALLLAGHSVRILDNLNPLTHSNQTTPPPWVSKDAEFILGDVRERETWERALPGIDTVVHLSAYMDYQPDYSTFINVNVVSIALMCEVIGAKKFPVRRIVAASSQAVYGDGFIECSTHGRVRPKERSNETLTQKKWEYECGVCGGVATFIPFKEDDVLTPKNCYGASKCSLETVLFTLGRQMEIPVVAARYSIVQGPRQSFRNFYSGALRTFAVASLAGSPLTIFEDGLQLRDYVNVADVTVANMMFVTDSRTDNQSFNVGCGQSYTVTDLASAVATEVGVPFNPVYGSYRYGDTRHAISDTSTLRALGWAPKHTLEESIHSYVSWVREFPEAVEFLKIRMKEMETQGVIKTY